MLITGDMQHIHLDELTTVTGGTRTISGNRSLDTATQQQLTQLSSDIKDLARNTTGSQSQMTQLMTIAVMSRMMQR